MWSGCNARTRWYSASRSGASAFRRSSRAGSTACYAGVSFDISDPAHVKPALTHLKRIVALTSYGRPRWMAFVMGDPPRKVIKRYLRALTGGKARIDYHARYHMNVATPAGLERHMQRIESLMAKI
jgi:NAD(P)H dehydrogenase (quinone)